MIEHTSFLITLFNYGRYPALIKFALKVNKELLNDDCVEYPMELENRKQLRALLPSQIDGEIVAVETIADVLIHVPTTDELYKVTRRKTEAGQLGRGSFTMSKHLAEQVASAMASIDNDYVYGVVKE